MGRKRGSGEGSIFKNGKSWRGQIVLGGERKSVSGKTKKEVVDKLAKLRVQYNNGELIDQNDITVEEWVKRWLNIKIQPNVAESSYVKIEGQLRKHVLPYLGSVKLQDLNRSMIEAAYHEAFDNGKGGKWKRQDYSMITTQQVSTSFKRCLQYAVDRNILAKNPHQGVELGKYREARKVFAYSKEEQYLIIQKCKFGKPSWRIFYFLVSTGLRYGEAAALSWDDVDLETGKISISKTTTVIGGSVIIQDRTKTIAGVRTIFVGENITQWLTWHQSQQDQSQNKSGLLFPSREYNAMSHANCAHAWRRVCAELDIPYQGMHSLRHTWATRALEAGVDIKTVSQMLGHKNIITTMNIYQDVLDDQKIKAACTLNAQF